MSREVGDWLEKLVAAIEPDCSIDAMLKYEVDDTSLTWILSHAFLFMWEKRQKNKKSFLNEYIPILSADLETLSSTRHENIATIASHYISI